MGKASKIEVVKNLKEAMNLYKNMYESVEDNISKDNLLSEFEIFLRKFEYSNTLFNWCNSSEFKPSDLVSLSSLPVSIAALKKILSDKNNLSLENLIKLIKKIYPLFLGNKLLMDFLNENN